MNSIIVNMVATAGIIVSGFAFAVEMPPVGKSKCGICHSIDKATMAPSFMEIAEKFKGDKDASKKIAASITMGGSFGWEYGKMPARGLGASDAEILSLSKFIAGLAK